jgi:hypothetical protein
MPRLSRIAVPRLPHHVTQRGNRRQALFTRPGDNALHRNLMAERRKANGAPRRADRPMQAGAGRGELRLHRMAGDREILIAKA